MYLQKPTITATAILGFFAEYRWLSNFYVRSLVVGNLKFETSEHVYQAFKTIDPDVRLAIQKHPLKGLKKFCYSIKLRDGWVDRNLRIKAMWRTTKAKYDQNPDLLQKLLALKGMHLEERNTWGDNYWGTTLVNKRWQGENMLGQVLMAYRDYKLGFLNPDVCAYLQRLVHQQILNDIHKGK